MQVRSWIIAPFLAAQCAVLAADHVHVRHSAVCTPVSVVGDATYCLDAANICGGVVGACPKRGDVASANCIPTLKSYSNDAAGAKCIAPADAECKPIPSGVLGCVFPPSTATTSVPATTSGAPVTTSSTRVPRTAGSPSTDSPKTICADDWGQCGGQSRTQTFSNCCHNATFACKAFNVYYSQCIPVN